MTDQAPCHFRHAQVLEKLTGTTQKRRMFRVAAMDATGQDLLMWCKEAAEISATHTGPEGEPTPHDGQVVEGHVRAVGEREWLELVRPAKGYFLPLTGCDPTDPDSGYQPVLQEVDPPPEIPLYVLNAGGGSIGQVGGASGAGGGVGLPEIFHEGWLWKTRAGSYLPFTQVRERWFELRGTELAWFESDGGESLGSIDVEGVTVTPTEDNTFHVAFKGGREDILRAENMDECAQWIRAMRGKFTEAIPPIPALDWPKFTSNPAVAA